MWQVRIVGEIQDEKKHEDVKWNESQTTVSCTLHVEKKKKTINTKITCGFALHNEYISSVDHFHVSDIFYVFTIQKFLLHYPD